MFKKTILNLFNKPNPYTKLDDDIHYGFEVPQNIFKQHLKKLNIMLYTYHRCGSTSQHQYHTELNDYTPSSLYEERDMFNRKSLEENIKFWNDIKNDEKIKHIFLYKNYMDTFESGLRSILWETVNNCSFEGSIDKNITWNGPAIHYIYVTKGWNGLVDYILGLDNIHSNHLLQNGRPLRNYTGNIISYGLPVPDSHLNCQGLMATHQTIHQIPHDNIHIIPIEKSNKLNEIIEVEDDEGKPIIFPQLSSKKNYSMIKYDDSGKTRMATTDLDEMFVSQNHWNIFYDKFNQFCIKHKYEIQLIKQLESELEDSPYFENK